MMRNHKARVMKPGSHKVQEREGGKSLKKDGAVGDLLCNNGCMWL